PRLGGRARARRTRRPHALHDGRRHHARRPRRRRVHGVGHAGAGRGTGRRLALSNNQFTAYGPSHWGVLILFVIGAGLLVWVGRRQTDRQGLRLGRVLGAITAVIYAAILVYVLTPPSIDTSVPLQLTDLATMVGAYALWSQKQWAYALTYYWGLVLSTQALISPALQSPDFPNYQFLAFWAIHLLVVWAAIYLTWGRGMRPDWRSYRLAIVV